MSQNEIVRLSDLGLSASAVAARMTPAVEALVADGNTAARRARLVELIREQHEPMIGNSGLDETLESIREEMRKFAAQRSHPECARLAPDQQLYPARYHHATWPSSACSA